MLESIAVLAACSLGYLVVAHPHCHYDERTVDVDGELTYCSMEYAPAGICCTAEEEAVLEVTFNAAGDLTSECADYYKQMLCGVCGSFSGHLYDRFAHEFGTENGLTMKGEFCSNLTTACDGQIDFPDFDGMGYCTVLTGGDDDLAWSYPYKQSGIFDGEFNELFPDLPDSDHPDTTIAMHQSPDRTMFWIAGKAGMILRSLPASFGEIVRVRCPTTIRGVQVDADSTSTSSTVMDLSGGIIFDDSLEEGLLDFAFSPMFDANKFFYVSWTVNEPFIRNRLSKFQYYEGDPDATRNSEEVLLETAERARFFHNGGWLGFKPSDYGTAIGLSDEIDNSLGIMAAGEMLGPLSYSTFLRDDYTHSCSAAVDPLNHPSIELPERDGLLGQQESSPMNCYDMVKLGAEEALANLRISFRMENITIQCITATYHDLYWALGDRGPQQDPLDHGQRTDILYGSVVRISVPSDGTGYQVPIDNYPDAVLPEICAIGFRNIWRCGFDRRTDELYCGDVGHNEIESIDIVECGNNYGWVRFEGSRCTEYSEDTYGSCVDTDRSGYTFPIFEYCHDASSSYQDDYTNGIDICGDHNIEGSAVIGGYVYRGQTYVDLIYGAYVFGDYDARNIYYILQEDDGTWTTGTIISDGSVGISSFSEDMDGELYMIDSTNKIYYLPCGDLCEEEIPEDNDTTATNPDDDDYTTTYEYIGCYGDQSDRVLSERSLPSYDGMTTEFCAGFCIGSAYFGTQYGSECYCGEATDDPTILGSARCGHDCAGDSAQTCGGRWALSVYQYMI